MNIHEYQAKGLLRNYGAPVSDGRIVVKSEDAKTAAGELDGPVWVVKAQIHAGGRGKGSFKEQDAGESGGVRIAKSVEQAAEEAKKKQLEQLLKRPEACIPFQQQRQMQQMHLFPCQEPNQLAKSFHKTPL